MKHKHLSSGIQKKYLKSTLILLLLALLLSMIGVWSYMHHTLKNNIIEKYEFADEKMGILLDNLYTKSKEVTAEAILNETIQKSLNAEELTDNEKNAVGKYFSYLDLDSIQDYCYMRFGPRRCSGSATSWCNCIRGCGWQCPSSCNSTRANGR